jgi:hypothetical protein
MFRLKLILIIIGATLIFKGYEEFKVSQKTSDVASEVELADLEKSGALENNYVTIGEHWAVFPACIYEYKTSKYDSKEPNNSTKVTSTYYPIISNAHPYIVTTDALALQYGGYDKIPDEKRPDFKQFAILVKTNKYKTIGAIPEDWLEQNQVTGLVVNEVDPLESDEMNLLRENFPRLNFDKVLILEQDRVPSSNVASFGIMSGGGLVCVIGLLWLFRRKQ